MADGAFTKFPAQHGLWDAALVDMKDDDEIMKKLMTPVAVGMLMLGPADRYASASTLGFGASDPLASFGNFAGANRSKLAFSHPTSATSDHSFRSANDVGDGVFGNAHRSRLELSEAAPPLALLPLTTALGGMTAIGDRRLKAQV